jgi:hypothetical protein
VRSWLPRWQPGSPRRPIAGAVASACAAVAAFTRISGLFLACGLVVLLFHTHASNEKPGELDPVIRTRWS